VGPGRSEQFLRAVSHCPSQPIVSVTEVARPRIYDQPRVTTAVRLTPAMRDQLHKAAVDRGVSVNQLVVEAMSEYLRKVCRARPATTSKGS
jgi:hypothetical protein